MKAVPDSAPGRTKRRPLVDRIVVAILLALTACAGSLPAAPGAALADLKPGIPYSQLRHALVRSGWSPVDAPDDVMPATAAPYAYPELTCGQGYDAVCSATFRSKAGAICLS